MTPLRTAPNASPTLCAYENASLPPPPPCADAPLPDLSAATLGALCAALPCLPLLRCRHGAAGVVRPSLMLLWCHLPFTVCGHAMVGRSHSRRFEISFNEKMGKWETVAKQARLNATRAGNCPTGRPDETAHAGLPECGSWEGKEACAEAGKQYNKVNTALPLARSTALPLAQPRASAHAAASQPANHARASTHLAPCR